MEKYTIHDRRERLDHDTNTYVWEDYTVQYTGQSLSEAIVTHFGRGSRFEGNFGLNRDGGNRRFGQVFGPNGGSRSGNIFVDID